jgi:sterol desaturase/sphingolipid hydroxylase (fatty acid hydroxylase superfamily)
VKFPGVGSRPVEVSKILFGFVFLAVFGSLIRLLERRFPARPPTRLFARSRVGDLFHWLVGATLGNQVANAFFFVAVLYVLPLLVIPRLGFPHQEHGLVMPLKSLPIPVQVILALVLGDFFAYWSHRIMHGATFWRFHAIHHSSRELDWFASARNHPLGEAVGRVFGGIPLVILGIDPSVLGGIVPFIGLWAIFLHANVRWTFGPLRWVIATPLFHRWHHSRALEARDKNFAGLFPIWDLAFGTFYLPNRQPDDFGVDAHESVPDGFVAQMLHPLRRRRRYDKRALTS